MSNDGLHPGLPVAGYSAQSKAAVDLMNGNKQLEECVLRNLDNLFAAPAIDQRWVAIARSHIEMGFMAMNRAVFRPGRVALPGDQDA